MGKTKGGRSPEAIARHARRQAEWEASEPARIASAEKQRRNKMSPSQLRREKEAAQKINEMRKQVQINGGMSSEDAEAALEARLQKGLALSRSNPLVGEFTVGALAQKEYNPLDYHDPNCIVVATHPLGAFECGGSNCKRSPVDSGMDER